MLTGATRRHARRRAHEPFERIVCGPVIHPACGWCGDFPPLCPLHVTRHVGARLERSREDPCQPVAGGRAPTTRRVCGVENVRYVFQL